MKQRTRVTDWPIVRTNLSPQTLERIEDTAERRALSVAAIIREALDASFSGKRPERV